MNAGLGDAFSVYAFQYRQALGAPPAPARAAARRGARRTDPPRSQPHAAAPAPRAGLTELQLAGLGTAKDAGGALFGAAAGFAFDAAPAWLCVPRRPAAARRRGSRALAASRAQDRGRQRGC